MALNHGHGILDSKYTCGFPLSMQNIAMFGDPCRKTLLGVGKLQIVDVTVGGLSTAYDGVSPVL